MDGKCRYDEVLESLSDGISIQDRDFRILYQNRAHIKLGGEHTGEICYIAYGEKKHICPGCPLALTFADGKTHRHEKAAEKNGRKFFIEITTSPLLDESGYIYAGIELVQDITERKRLNQALKESEEKFRNLVEGAPVGVFIIQDNMPVYTNPIISEVLGYSTEELHSNPAVNFVVPEDRDVLKSNAEDLLKGVIKNTRHHYRFIRKNGMPIEVESHATGTIFKGRPAIIGTLLDITERKLLERQKEDFYAMVTHDLRSPLTGIIGYTQVILEAYKGTLDENLLGMIKKISESSFMLSSIMEDYLTYSEIEHDSLKPVLENVDLAGLLENVYDEFKLFATKKGIDLRNEAGNKVPKAMVDENLMRRAISNLFQNAVKYTPYGGTVVMKAETRIAGGEDLIAVSISDSGPGIPESEKENIFNKYYRAKSSAGTKGSGLGLTIVKSIAMAHGGRVELVSAEGAGSTFTILIPAGPAEDATQ